MWDCDPDLWYTLVAADLEPLGRGNPLLAEVRYLPLNLQTRVLVTAVDVLHSLNYPTLGIGLLEISTNVTLIQEKLLTTI